MIPANKRKPRHIDFLAWPKVLRRPVLSSSRVKHAYASNGEISLFKDQGLLAGSFRAYKGRSKLLAHLQRSVSKVLERVGVEERGSALTSEVTVLVLIGIYKSLHEGHLAPKH